MKAVLDRIDPVCCTYEEWIHVGMALKHEGYSPGLWDEWSKRDPARYHTGECQKKWYSFHNDCTNVITGATLYHMAHLNKWTADNEKEITWGSAITVESPAPTEGLPDASMPQQASDTAAATSGGWHPASMLISYLEILFQPDEIVSYCMQSYKNRKSGKYVPKNRGSYDRTAGELISELRNCSDDIGAVFGDYDPEGGAWIRFNPVDGKGIRNENVTSFRHALVESDDMPVGDQLHFLHEMHLPIAVLVHSGGKSLHAVVRVDAHNYEEYRERVSFLYDTCEKHGMHIDRQNKNPSRMSRMPGVIRGSAKQYIIESNIGAAGWDEWCTFIKGQEEEIKRLAGCETHIVAGNNDYFSTLPREEEFEIGHYKVFLTHGHGYGVSVGTERIVEEAVSRGVDAVIYGHTHKPLNEKIGGIRVLNPGSLSYPRQEGRDPSYMLMEFDRAGNMFCGISYL